MDKIVDSDMFSEWKHNLDEDKAKSKHETSSCKEEKEARTQKNQSADDDSGHMMIELLGLAAFFSRDP